MNISKFKIEKKKWFLFYEHCFVSLFFFLLRQIDTLELKPLRLSRVLQIYQWLAFTMDLKTSQLETLLLFIKWHKYLSSILVGNKKKKKIIFFYGKELSSKAASPH